MNPTVMEPLRLDACDLAQNSEEAATAGAAVAMAGGIDACVIEPKLDGWRLLLEVREDCVAVYSRTGKRYDGQLPHVEAEVRERFPVGTWLDGEAVCMSVTDGLVDVKWGVVQSVMTTTRRRHPATASVSFLAFDLIAHGGRDARALPFGSRRRLLERVFAGRPFRTLALIPQYAPDAFGSPDAGYAAFLSQGFEGAMVKRTTAPYASGCRGRGWWKVKPEHTMEGVVMGADPGKGGFTGLIGALIFGQHDAEGNLVRRGQCSGMTLAQRKAFTVNLDRMVEEGAVIEVAYTEVQDSGALRHARFKRLRPDRDAASVLLDPTDD